MARIGTSWNRIQAGDIITFNYKSKGTTKQRLQTILVLNPKWYIVVDNERHFTLIGFQAFVKPNYTKLLNPDS